MEDFCHAAQAIERFMYSMKLLPVKTDRAVFTCDVCVRFSNWDVCSSFIQNISSNHRANSYSFQRSVAGNVILIWEVVGLKQKLSMSVLFKLLTALKAISEHSNITHCSDRFSLSQILLGGFRHVCKITKNDY
jgi:hypothetical protein